MQKSGPSCLAGAGVIPRSRLPEEWLQWVHDSIAAGIDDATVTVTLERNGFPAALVQKEVRQARNGRTEPVTNRSEAERLRKLESLLAVRNILAQLSPQASVVERRRHLSREDFLGSFYAANRPIVVTEALSGSAAGQRWTPEYLDEVCGDSVVEVMARRDANPTYEIESDAHRTKMRFSEYIRLVTAATSSNDVYLVANNDFFAMPNADVLLAEVPKLSEYLSWDAPTRQVFFWFGPAGTVTPLHHDLMNVMLAQIRGRKHFTLISPDQTPWMYNTVGVYSAVDCEKPNFIKFPLFHKVRKIELDLYPGEVLFIPVGWWHHVRALDLSMTVTYTNFLFPNAFEWSHARSP
jgi:ribosomal protein L16 Arg81 hydroxylase